MNHNGKLKKKKMAPEKASPEVVNKGRKNLRRRFFKKVGITDFKGKEEISLKMRKKKA